MSDKVYDSVFKTMAQKMPQLLAPFVAEVFGLKGLEGKRAEPMPTGFQLPRRRIDADAVFRLGGSTFHLECQSSRDPSMGLRMLEYDFAIALADARSRGTTGAVAFPRSAVFYPAGAPRGLEVAVEGLGFADNSLAYAPAVVDAGAFSLDYLVDAGLWLVVPFYLARYERRMRRAGGPTARARSEYLADCGRLGEAFAKGMASGEGELYNELVRLTVRVSDHILRGQDDLAGEARSAMGGEVLELISEKMERLEREGRELRREGRIEGRQELAGRLLELGVDKSIIDRALAEGEAARSN